MPVCRALGCTQEQAEPTPFCSGHQYLMDVGTHNWRTDGQNLLVEEDIFDVNDKPTPVSVADDRLDKLVEAASVPNLADLFKKGRESGIIQARQAYE